MNNIQTSDSLNLGDNFDFRTLPEFDDHRLLSFTLDKSTGLFGVIAIHRANQFVPSFGATRMWHYATNLEGVQDALRLSRLMSYKAALAGLECGGAKGVIILKQPLKEVPDIERTNLIKQYASRVALLGGSFITGTDVGIQQENLAVMKSVCPYIVGFNDNSTEFTALGLYESIKVALEQVFGSPEPEGHSFAIQGLGKVGGGLLALLYEPAGSAAKIYVSDIDPEQVKKMQVLYPRIIPVLPEDIDKQNVDVFAPCALSGAINSRNIPNLKAKIVAGGANNQLEKESDGNALHARNILYVPDYIANSGGLIAVFDEYKNSIYERERVENAVLRIPDTLRKIFTGSQTTGQAPVAVAKTVAEDIFNNYGHGKS